MSGLSSLVPEAVGIEAARAVGTHVLCLAQKLYPDAPAGAMLTVMGDQKALLETPIAGVMCRLTRYAQHGLPVAGWSGREDVEQAVNSALSLLAPAVRPTEGEEGEADQQLAFARSERPSTIALVLFCAQQRLELDAFESIPVSALARLGSVSDQRVHDLVAAGTIKRSRRTAKDHTAYVEAKSALRWLDSRCEDPLFTTAVEVLSRKLRKPSSMRFVDGEGRATWEYRKWFVELQSKRNGPCSVVAALGVKGEEGCGTWGLRQAYEGEEWVPVGQIGEKIVQFIAAPTKPTT